tara:strand:- start:1435 stop:1629 length:195 start_codon:yes stop_codon:yes gene_type:complete
MGKQIELWPELYPPAWECEHCGEDTSNVDYDYIGSGYNHLQCDLKEEEEKQEWPGLDAISKEWV